MWGCREQFSGLRNRYLNLFWKNTTTKSRWPSWSKAPVLGHRFESWWLPLCLFFHLFCVYLVWKWIVVQEAITHFLSPGGTHFNHTLSLSRWDPLPALSLQAPQEAITPGHPNAIEDQKNAILTFIINAIRPKKCHPSLHQTDPRIQCSGKSTNWMVPAFTSLGTTSSNGAAFTRHGRNYMRNQRLNNNETKLKIESRTSPSINEKTPVQCSPPRSR